MNLFKFLKEYTLYLIYTIKKKGLPEAHHVARYLGGSKIDDGHVLASGFSYNKNNGEKELSVNWLEFFDTDAGISENIKDVRIAYKTKGYEVGSTAKFGILNVREIREEVKSATAEHTELVSLITRHSPAIKRHSPVKVSFDLSHSSIAGMPTDEDGELLVSRALANCVFDELHVAKE